MTYVDGDDFFSLREPALSNDECFSLDRADGQPQVGKDGDYASEKSL